MARPRSGTDDAVVAVLTAAQTPMTAYQILDQLRPVGVQSPPVVYRALERLMKVGRIHRLEQTNAYFACQGHDHHDHHPPVFAVCRICGQVEEWPGETLDRQVASIARPTGFRVDTRTIEIRGVCRRCASQATS